MYLICHSRISLDFGTLKNMEPVGGQQSSALQDEVNLSTIYAI